jgi:hypothetical protein
MRTVSACACARVQSKVSAAAAAAEFFSSVLREVGMVFSPVHRRFRRVFLLFIQVCVKGFEKKGKSDSSIARSRCPLVT